MQPKGQRPPNHAEVIAEMHESANIVLAYWHYFNCKTDPRDLQQKARSKTPLRNLTEQQFERVCDLWWRVDNWKSTQGSAPIGNRECFSPDTDVGRVDCILTTMFAATDTGASKLYENTMGHDWCHPLYFAAQMFAPEWSPQRMYTS